MKIQNASWTVNLTIYTKDEINYNFSFMDSMHSHMTLLCKYEMMLMTVTEYYDTSNSLTLYIYMSTSVNPIRIGIDGMTDIVNRPLSSESRLNTGLPIS